MRILMFVVFLLVASPFQDSPAIAQKSEDDFHGRKFALVIGNAKYAAAPLVNPENDANDIAAVLSKTGFKVTTILNADRAAFQLALANFESSLPPRAAILMFYAGHAVQYQGQNFLLPIDAVGKVSRADELFSHSIPLAEIVERLTTRKDTISTLILDACRDTPFPNTPEISGGLSRGAGKSIARKDEPKRRKSSSMEGAVIAYSTAPGMTAADGEGRNSPYTKHLKELLRRPDTSLDAILKLTRTEVTKETNGKQTPWYESSVNGEFYPAGRGRIEFEDLLRFLVPIKRDVDNDDGGRIISWALRDDVADPIRWEKGGLGDMLQAGRNAPYFSFENPHTTIRRFRARRNRNLDGRWLDQDHRFDESLLAKQSSDV